MKWLVVVAGLGCAACEPEMMPPQPHHVDYRDSDGRKVMVMRRGNQIAGKLRVRKKSIRVYDEQLHPIGTLMTDSLVFSPFPEGEAVELKTTEPGVVEFGQQMRVETLRDRWAVFGAGAQWVGYVRSEPTWSFETATGETWKAEEGRVRSGAETVCSAASTVTPPMLLALCIEGLPIPARVALGQWLSQSATSN